MSEIPQQTWLGTPMPDIYHNKGPWHFAVPPIHPTKYHHVLYTLPASLTRPSEPYTPSCPKHWDEHHVRMPYSDESLFLVTNNNEENISKRWQVITEALCRPIQTAADLENAIVSYNTRLPKFAALHRLLDDVYGEQERIEFFETILPGIITLCLSLPDAIPGGIPLLARNHCKSISLSKMQAAVLLANGFLCTFVWRKEIAAQFPSANFARLFAANERPKRQCCVTEKLKCILHYFKRVIAKSPIGVITFERKSFQKWDVPRWDLLDTNLGNTRIHVNSSGKIEEAHGLLQVDFANKKIGGGVLGYGCVQEEIRFIICPELIVARLFAEELGDLEAIAIYGAEQYCNYAGYSDDFKFAGDHHDATPFDEFARRKLAITVIDATRFNRAKDQYHCSAMLRELNKAFVGFSAREKSNVAAVASGNWGCGAFKGDAGLKSLLQLMACSAANRDLVYYTFGDVDLRDRLYKMYIFIANNQVTIAQLWRYLCQFCVSNVQQDGLYSFIQQCHFDLKSQPSIKQFFNLKSQKRKSLVEFEAKPDQIEPILESKPKICNISSKYKPLAISVNKAGPSKRPTINTDEIFGLIDMIDGETGFYCGNDDQNSDTLLSTIDKMKSEAPNSVKNEHVVIPMEVDIVEEPANLYIDEKKKKITDYFTKMNTNSS